MNKAYICIKFIFVFAFLFKNSFGEIGLAPGRFEFKFPNKFITKELNIVNPSEDPIRVEANISSIPKEAADRFSDLAPYITKISPQRVVVPPKGSRVIRFTIKNPSENISSGKYGAVIYIKEILKNPQTIVQQLNNNITTKIAIQKEVGVAIVAIKED